MSADAIRLGAFHVFQFRGDATWIGFSRAGHERKINDSHNSYQMMRSVSAADYCWSCNVNLNAALATAEQLSVWTTYNINNKLTAQYSVGAFAAVSPIPCPFFSRSQTHQSRQKTHKKHKFISFLIKMIFNVIKLMVIAQTYMHNVVKYTYSRLHSYLFDSQKE